MMDLSKAMVSLPYTDLDQLIQTRNTAVEDADNLRRQLMEANQRIITLEAAQADHAS